MSVYVHILAPTYPLAVPPSKNIINHTSLKIASARLQTFANSVRQILMTTEDRIIGYCQLVTATLIFTINQFEFGVAN
jgi:hypothetical protein